MRIDIAKGAGEARGVEWFVGDDFPPIECLFEVRSAGPARQGSPSARSPGEHENGGVGSGEASDLPTGGLPLVRGESVHGSEIPKEVEAGRDAGGPERGYVAADNFDLKA